MCISPRSRVVILDEATAAVDPRTNRIIQDAVDEVFRRQRSSTVILISHRLQDVMGCDRVIVMKDGEVVEIGKPKELLRRSGGGGGGGGHFRALAAEAGIEA